MIADLLHAWTAEGGSCGPAHALLSSCAGHLVGLQNLVPFSSRLQRLVIRSVGLIGCKGFEGVGMERFIELLNHLHVTAEDMDDKFHWAKILLETFQTSEGAQRASHSYWELLMELAISLPWFLRKGIACSPQITTSLAEAKEWSRLECWIGIVWMLSPWKANAMAKGDFGHSMLLLFHQRPGAVQKLEQWMERWSQKYPFNHIPESFQRICKQAHEAAQQDPP